MLPPTMDPRDFQTDTWKRLAARLEARIDELHQDLEKTLDEAATARVRGRIAELRTLLALPGAPADESADPSHGQPTPPLAGFNF